MRRPLVCLAVLLLAAQVSPAQDETDTPLERLELLKRTLSKHEVWQAEYLQRYTPAGMTITEEVRGRVWISLPDRAYFHDEDPAFRSMGLEGRVVRLLDLEISSCDDHVLDDDEWVRVPLAAVLDPTGALEHFSVLEHGERGIALVPREPGGVDRVEVELDAGGLPVQVVVIDPQGAANRLSFSGWKKASSPPKNSWLPTPPDGVDCIVAE